MRVWGWMTAAMAATGLATSVAAQEPTSDLGPLSVEKVGGGEATPLVAVPGLATAGAMWTEPLAPFEADRSVWRVDVPGFGGAEPVADRTEFLVRAGRSLAAQLPGEGAVVVGHSLGGQIALETARAAPDRVKGVVIVDSLPFLAQLYDPNVTPEAATARAAFFGNSIRNAPREAYLAQQRQGLPIQTKTPEFLPSLDAWMTASDQATIGDALEAGLARDARESLADIGAPILVLAAWDPAMPLPRERIEALFAEQYAAAPDARVQVIENSFHFIMIDQPEAFQDAVDAFLAAIDGGAEQ